VQRRTEPFGRAWFRSDDGMYLSVLLGSSVLARMMGIFWPDIHVPGQTPTTTWAAVGIVITFVAWLAFRPRVRWDTMTLTFLAAVLVAWVGSVWSTFRHDDALDLGYLVVPLALALVAAKRPSGPAVTRALDVLAWSTALLCLGMLGAQLTGLLDKATAGTNTSWDSMSYWVPLSDPLGIYGRWVGPFVTPNNTAVVAVFLVVWGASRGMLNRIVVTGTGVLVLVLVGSRASTLIAALGVAVLAALWPARRRWVHYLQRVFGGLLVLVAVLGTLFWVWVNPTLSGRTRIWPVYYDLWLAAPVGGAGDSGVGLAVEDGRLPEWATVAHSIYLDPLSRHGVIVALLVLAALGMAVVITVGAARRGRPVGIALVLALLVGGLTETLFDWRYLGYQITVLVGAVLVSTAYLRTPGHVVSTLRGLRRPRSAAVQRRADAYVALDAAAAGAQVVRSRLRTSLEIHEKAAEDFATDVSIAAESAIREVLGGTAATEGRIWLVDPLCGTVNFAAGVPLLGTNVALTVDGHLGAAAVADPIRDERFWTDGTEAWRWTGTNEDVPMRPDARAGGVAFDTSLTPGRTATLLASPDFARRFRPVMLATSLAAAWVADGRLAAYVGEDSPHGNPHYAAGFAVALAAGCVATDLRGMPLGPDAAGFVLAADRETHTAILAALGVDQHADEALADGRTA
jgi:myo-inositol-1(or 4)-monophosphatase